MSNGQSEPKWNGSCVECVGKSSSGRDVRVQVYRDQDGFDAAYVYSDPEAENTGRIHAIDLTREE